MPVSMRPHCSYSETRRLASMSPVRTASRPRGHDNLSPGKSHRGRGKPAAGDRVLPRLRCGDLALNPREQLFRFREGQSQIGDIAEVIGLADLHDVHAGILVPGCRQLRNPLHAPPPVQEQERKYPARTGTPSFTPVPRAIRCGLGISSSDTLTRTGRRACLHTHRRATAMPRRGRSNASSGSFDSDRSLPWRF